MMISVGAQHFCFRGFLPSLKNIKIIFYNCVGTSMNVIQARFIIMYLLLFSLFILFKKKLKSNISRGP